ncbi:hypothetical protein, partial [Pseudoalteromonas sp. NEC-BIFX-2020_015]|uniref:hypothetical protein n=1 Tax=Pseudoalteromonas sp. NEC-BIFX-2020_015 TaxID=2729544 RepID=UPI001BA86909
MLSDERLSDIDHLAPCSLFHFPADVKNPDSVSRAFFIWSLAMTYFHITNATLSSALFRFTTEFGMGSGG